ncbi:unnamed protein product [Linum tenue]|uniref:DYW domain-containing protein n=1 Tax=Linum tenue TaxID=586396 RepID=A0AAV0KL05_9ROSI|nr:unnamed protein product [Linum tenue]
MLQRCIQNGDHLTGRAHHCAILKTGNCLDLFAHNVLLNLYVNGKSLTDARKVFDEMPLCKDMVSWTGMVACYAENSCFLESFQVFSDMRRIGFRPNHFTLAAVLKACVGLEAFDLAKGTQVHCHVLKLGFLEDIFITNALMDVYAKCSLIENSLTLFLGSSITNDVSWNTMIVGFVHAGDFDSALSFFKDTLECHNVQPTEVTYSSALCACASLAALDPGTQIHCLTMKTTYDKNTVVGNALIDMYAKCGSIKDARLVFNGLTKNDEVSWNAMISGYSMHGLGGEALKVFDMMQETDVRPNQMTFVGVLSACSNGGLLSKGEAYFKSMIHDHGIEPCVEHYSCMVWLLGRLGHLDRALKLIKEMPFEPSLMAWRALLGACVIHNDVEIGKLCAKHILEIDPQDESTHVLLSNMYARTRRWANVATVRRSMKTKGLNKEPGLSWIENQGTVHYFTVDDASHPDKKMIYGMLEWLNMKTRQESYSPDRNAVLRDIEDDQKERHLWVHSERLALAFGLIKTPSGSSPIRIIKNLRICADCHAVMKLISKIVKRDIIVRDMNRFHHFENGLCSCGDYW